MSETQVANAPGVQEGTPALHVKCDAMQAFNFDFKEMTPTGYILSIKLKDDPLDVDWGFKDPENPGELIKAVAVLEEVYWSRKPTDPFKFVGRISAKNRIKFEDWINRQDTTSKIAISWVTKQFDVNDEQYFPRFHSDGAEIKFVRADSPASWISDHHEKVPANPHNFRFTLYLTPDSKEGQQTLGFASAASHKSSMLIGTAKA